MSSNPFGAKEIVGPRPEARRSIVDLIVKLRPQEDKAARFFADIATQYEHPVLVCEGSLKLQGDVQLSRPLLVLGDLDVEGCFEDAVKVDHNIVMVLGSVRARHWVSNSMLWVGGDMTVAGTMILESWGDLTTTVRGTLRAETALVGSHHFDVGTKDYDEEELVEDWWHKIMPQLRESS